MIGEVKTLLIIPHIKVHNANALSSPFTIGFPAMTAWLGAVHALQRHINQAGLSVIFSATGVVNHDTSLQTHKGHGDYVHSIIGTANPLDKTGARSAFIEEARCHLDVSLIIEFEKASIEQREQLLSLVNHTMQAKMKIAGGDIQHFQKPQCITIQDGDDKDVRKVQRMVMPGYAIIERRDLMVQSMEESEGQKGEWEDGEKERGERQKGDDAIEAMLDYLCVHHTCEVNENETDENKKITWQTQRKLANQSSAGWIVPIATGFHAISDIGEAKNQRDPNTLHRFAESVVTLGEFKMAHRFNFIEDLLWRYCYQTEDDLYLCQQGTYQQEKLQ